jgi:hypothetical protein
MHGRGKNRIRVFDRKGVEETKNYIINVWKRKIVGGGFRNDGKTEKVTKYLMGKISFGKKHFEYITPNITEFSCLRWEATSTPILMIHWLLFYFVADSS